MIFGKSYDQKDEIRKLAIKKNRDTPWFCWHPVQLDSGGWAWFENVYRTRKHFRLGSYWSYKLEKK